jgi:hypothetical protein
MRLLVAFGLIALTAASPAAAKDVESLVVVGADGRSVTLEPEREVLGVMLYHPASVYNVRPRRAAPRGGYVKIYPLGPGGMPAMHGRFRFYPATSALCFGWNQALPPRECGRLGPPRRLIAASRRVALFYGTPPFLALLKPRGNDNLFAALELAFDRYRSARTVPRPARCLRFTAEWYGPRSVQRPTSLCVSRRGVYARGRLYPAGSAVWWLARQ